MSIFQRFLILCSIFSYNQGAKISKLKVCSGGDYVRGKWILDENHKKSFSCCDPHVFNDCYIGMNDFEINYNKNFPIHSHSGCACQTHSQKNGVPRDESIDLEKFQWYPTSCRLVQWNATLFCHLLGNRTVLFLGDSTAHQTVNTLIAMLLKSFDTSQCIPQIKFEYSDKLVWDPDERKRGDNFVAWTDKHRPHILVIGAYAHYHHLALEQEANASDISFLNYFYPKFSEGLEYLKRTHPQLQKIVIKTENPGHWDHCHLNKMPVPFENASLGYLEGQHATHTHQDKYHWHMGTLVDKFMKNIARKHNFPIIDMSPLLYRPDAHPAELSNGDCLHYCTPGPLDLFSRIFLHKLYIREI